MEHDTGNYDDSASRDSKPNRAEGPKASASRIIAQGHGSLPSSEKPERLGKDPRDDKSVRSSSLSKQSATLKKLRTEMHGLSQKMGSHIDAARTGKTNQDLPADLLQQFVAVVDDDSADEQALQRLIARGVNVDPVLEAGADFVERLQRDSVKAEPLLSRPGSVGDNGPQLIIPSMKGTAEVPFYAAKHIEAAEIVRTSLENFPPLPSLQPVTEERFREMVAEIERQGANSSEAQKVLDDFKLTKSTLLFLKLEWTFGINRHVPFVNLATDTQRSIFYCVGHTAVVYSYEQKGKPIEPTQILLEGLDRQITCIAATKNGRWLAAGDTGPDYAAIIWDLQQDAVPMRVYTSPCGKEAYGLASLCFSPSMRYLAMLSTGERQILCIYEWLVHRKNERGSPEALLTYELPDGETLQSQLDFDAYNQEMLVSCSRDRVLLFQWSPTKSSKQVRLCIPNTKKVSGIASLGEIRKAVFVGSSSHVVVGTSTGVLILYRKRVTHKKYLVFEDYAELVKGYSAVSGGSITALVPFNGMVAVGDSLGGVRFYDSSLLILYTCSNIGYGSIDSISFAKLRIHKDLSTKFDYKAGFLAEFMIGTDTGCVVNVRTAGDDGYKSQLLREEPRDAVISCAVHPNAARLAIGCSQGVLTMWDYKHKSVIRNRQLRKQGCVGDAHNDVTCLAFDPTGVYLACGSANGELRIMTSLELADEDDAVFGDSVGRILFIEFSYDGLSLATADDEGVICLYHNNTGEWAPTWTFVGNQHAHTGSVLSLLFVKEHGCDKERLFTLGLDSCLVEYDLDTSKNGDLLIIYREHVDPESQTFSVGYYPPVAKECFLITANNKYKLKLWNVATKMCRKTINGPLQGSPVMGLKVLPNHAEGEQQYILWNNADSVGLMALPLDGSPYRYCSRRVHPFGITSMKSSANGCFVFTAGGAEACVHMWSIHPEVMGATLEGKKDTLMPFFDLLEGGMEGKMYEDMEECFCYLQMKAQGMETREARKVTDRLPLAELSNLFCFLSYYPSEREQKNITNEIKYSKYADTGELVDNVDIGTALKTFVNHRPIWGVQYPEIIKAFARFGFEELRTTVRPAQLVQILKGGGECMPESEAIKALGVLMNLRPPLGDWETVGAERDYYNPKATLPKELTVEQIIEEVLAFQTKPAFYQPER